MSNALIALGSILAAICFVILLGYAASKTVDAVYRAGTFDNANTKKVKQIIDSLLDDPETWVSYNGETVGLSILNLTLSNDKYTVVLTRIHSTFTTLHELKFSDGYSAYIPNVDLSYYKRVPQLVMLHDLAHYWMQFGCITCNVDKPRRSRFQMKEVEHEYKLWKEAERKNLEEARINRENSINETQKRLNEIN